MIATIFMTFTTKRQHSVYTPCLYHYLYNTISFLACYQACSLRWWTNVCPLLPRAPPCTLRSDELFADVHASAFRFSSNSSITPAWMGPEQQT